MTKLKNFFVGNRKLFSVFFSVVFSVLVVAVLVHGATTIGTFIATDGALNSSGTALFDGSIKATGTLEVTGLLTTYDALVVKSAAADLRGKFYVDTSGNVSASGTLYAGANNTSDIGGWANAWKDLYASGTIRGGVLSAVSMSASSSLFSDQLIVNDTSGDGTGVFLVTSAGALNASSTVATWGALGVGLASSDVYGKFRVDTSGNVFASGTINVVDSNSRSVFYADSSGNVAASGTLSVAGFINSSSTATSTLGGDLVIDSSSLSTTAATSTLHIGGYTTTTNRGGCIALTAASGTVHGSGTLYLVVQVNSTGDAESNDSMLILATSTNPNDCY